MYRFEFYQNKIFIQSLVILTNWYDVIYYILLFITLYFVKYNFFGSLSIKYYITIHGMFHRIINRTIKFSQLKNKGKERKRLISITLRFINLRFCNREVYCFLDVIYDSWYTWLHKKWLGNLPQSVIYITPYQTVNICQFYQKLSPSSVVCVRFLSSKLTWRKNVIF